MGIRSARRASEPGLFNERQRVGMGSGLLERQLQRRAGRWTRMGETGNAIIACCATAPGAAVPGLRAAIRTWLATGGRNGYTGFRLARTLTP